MKISTNLKNFLCGRGSLRQALQGGKWEFRTGVGGSADDAATGSLLCEVVNADGGAWVQETRATAIITVTVTGTCTGITVEATPICETVTIPGTSLADDAAAIAEAINKYQAGTAGVGGYMFEAAVSGAVVTIFAPAGSGTAFNTTGTDMTIAVAGTITTTINGGSDDEMGLGAGGSTAGVAHSYGLLWDLPSAGQLAKDGVWSGTIDTTGTAGHVRITGNKDPDGNSYVCILTVGTSGAEYNMASTSMVAGIVHTINSFYLEIPTGS